MATETFGRWLKKRRSGLGLTQAELAARLGYAADTLRKIEADEKRPSKQLALALAEALELPTEQHAAFVRFARDEGDLPDLPTHSASVPLSPTPAKASLPHTLPTPPTPLVGREREQAALLDLLSRPAVRLVTLTGPGGIGKTRLALEVGHGLVVDPPPSALRPPPFPDGVYFVNLAPLTDPALVVAAIAQVLGVRETGGRPLLDSLTDFLREKHLLLLLDNFEQVTKAAPLVAALLAHAPGVKALVTSRETLRLDGEHPFPLDPLPLPELPRAHPFRPQDEARRAVYTSRVGQADAVRLFVQRAAVVKPGFGVTMDNAPTLAQICVRLDGLPLALELAAARVKLLTPEQMLVRLEGVAGQRPLRLLTSGGADLPARQQTLRTAIQWSYNLLEPAEQALFRRLGAFVGGATVEAVEAVCADEGEGESLLPAYAVIEGLASLLEKSLLTYSEGEGGAARFGMLETIREFALEQLAADGEAEAVQRRHAEYFVKLVEAAEPHWNDEQQVVWRARLSTDLNNLRAIQRWTLSAQGDAELGLRLAAALWGYWTGDHLSEGREWLRVALLHSTTTSDKALRAKALNGAAGLAYFQGDHAAARELTEEGLALRREVGDKEGVARSMQNLAMLFTLSGDDVNALPLLEESLRLMRELGDIWGTANVLNTLGILWKERGDYVAARSYYQQAVALWRTTGDAEAQVTGLAGLGYLALKQGDYSQARAWFEDMLTLARQGTRQGVGAVVIALAALGLVASRQDDYPTAEARYGEGLALAVEADSKQSLGEVLIGLAMLRTQQTRFRQAARLWGVVTALFEGLQVNTDTVAALRGHESAIGTLRAQLGETAFNTLLVEGRAMRLEEAVEYALAEEREERA